MTTEIFEGNAAAYKVRLDALIVGGFVINFTFPAHNKGIYIIIYT